MSEWEQELERDPDDGHDWDDYERYFDDYEGEMYESFLESLSDENVRSYLGSNGDAIHARVSSCLETAEKFLETDYPGPALVAAGTAIEVIIGFYLLRPLVQGAFLSDQWADLLTTRALGGRRSIDRKFLPKLARAWGIDILGVEIGDGKKLWDTYWNTVRKARNAHVHAGTPVSTEVAERALECARGLITNVVEPIAEKFWLSWPESGSWREAKEGVGGGKTTTTFPALNPFGDN